MYIIEKKINVHKKNRILRIKFKKVKLLDNEKNYCKISTYLRCKLRTHSNVHNRREISFL